MAKTGLILMAAVALAALWWLFAEPPVPALEIPDSAEAVERGGSLVAAGGCVSCHEGTEDPDSLSGGLALESDFGTFYAPNITPHEETGIGGWTAEDFLLALKHGRTPGGSFYYPAFPYTAYAGMTDQDALDIAAYLMAQPPVDFRPPDHELPGWLFRWTIAGWNRLVALLNPEPPEETDPVVARGAYLARHLGHCGECHTPRNAGNSAAVCCRAGRWKPSMPRPCPTGQRSSLRCCCRWV
jgi:mono/diheme cytochrome c family protein